MVGEARVKSGTAVKPQPSPEILSHVFHHTLNTTVFTLKMEEMFNDQILNTETCLFCLTYPDIRQLTFELTEKNYITQCDQRITKDFRNFRICKL